MKTNLKTIGLRFLILSLLVSLASCGSFRASRVDSSEADERGLRITDEWLAGDTEQVISEVIENIRHHQGFVRYRAELGRAPRLFIGEVQNLTSEAYFPINDINDELLHEISATGEFILIDADARDRILEEITYQHDGMVDPATASQVGRQTGADLMIFGNVHMQPQSRDGRTIKQYAVNIRMTDIEQGVEVMRTRVRLNKYSERRSFGW